MTGLHPSPASPVQARVTGPRKRKPSGPPASAPGSSRSRAPVALVATEVRQWFDSQGLMLLENDRFVAGESCFGLLRSREHIPPSPIDPMSLMCASRSLPLLRD